MIAIALGVNMSLLSWERGLKYVMLLSLVAAFDSRSSRGSVD